MKVAVLGGGPAGLYFAISMMRRDPSHEITVYERNRPGDTFGWGVVLSDQTLDNLQRNDPESAQALADALAHWDDIDVHFRGRTITSSGHGFSGIGRRRMLEILQDRAWALGVDLKFETEVGPDFEQTSDADLIIAADGLNSRVRNSRPEVFQTDLELRANRFVWLGTHQVFDAFTFIFVQTPHGWVWAHAYRFEDGASTFIIECAEATWRGLGFDRMDQAETCRAGEALFAQWLGGHALISNATHLRGSAWLQFPRVLCGNWRDGRTVLIGDAAHTAHFSIGSGTKLAVEDAIALAEVLHSGQAPDEALAGFQAEREVEVLKLQSAARNSTEWFEHLERYTGLEPEQFAYALLTRSQRVSHENLRLRDRDYLQGVESWFAGVAGAKSDPVPPPMFTPLSLRGMTVTNRVVVSPMCMYSAVEGTPGDFHFVHYGARAMGGAGLVFTEMTDVSAEGRISTGCTGMYTPEHQAAWTRIVDYVHGHSRAKIALQLGHAGPKAATCIPWQGGDNEPLAEGAWPILGPSAVPWSERHQTPREMTRADMDAVRDQFVRSTEMAVATGFDMVELHCAHGYLLSAFLTPVSNFRTDAYGGALENRLRFPLEVFAAMRAVWPQDRPMSVRLSATDWVPDGLSPEDTVAIARAFAEAGADLIDVSAGQTTARAKPTYGRMFQTPWSDLIRNEARVATMAVGNIYEPDHVNSILAAGRADLCALARPHLADPNWMLRAAAELGWGGLKPPVQYTPGHAQLRRNLERQQQMGAA